MEVLIICGSKYNGGIIAALELAYHAFLNGKKQGAGDIKIVASLAEWNAFKSEKQQPNFVFIQPELNWADTEFYGYEVAFELLADRLKEHFFDLRFISTEEYVDLLNIVSTKYRSILEAFACYHHVHDKLKIELAEPSYSPLHFELMRTLITNDIDRLNLIHHEVESATSIIRREKVFNPELQLIKIFRQIEELQLMEIIPAGELEDIRRRLQMLKTKPRCLEMLEVLGQKIRLARYQLLSEFTADINPNNKSKFKVLIVEDDLGWRTELSKIFSEYFEHVYPATELQIAAFKTADARSVVSEMQADVYILDLIYKDIRGLWFRFNGLDLYDLIKRKHPYSAVRIVSNLPRDMIAELSDAAAYPLHFSHVFPKKDGYIGAQSVIQNRLLELNLECSRNERLRKVFKLIPNTGFFKWEGMRSVFHLIMTQERTDYLEHRKVAVQLFESFKCRKLKKDAEHWNSGELMTQRMEKHYTKKYIVDKLTALFTHRLILIHKALEDNDHFISTADYETSVLKEFTNLSKFDASYFYKTGFHTKAHTDDKGTKGFIIHLKNLFPEEYQFVEDVKKARKVTDKDRPLIHFPDLDAWAGHLFGKPFVYKNWHLLGLDFSPYIGTLPQKAEMSLLPEAIRNNITVNELKQFLLALFEHYDQPAVEDMIMETISYEIGKSWKVPDDIRDMIEDLCAK